MVKVNRFFKEAVTSRETKLLTGAMFGLTLVPLCFLLLSVWKVVKEIRSLL